jgi:hypothetical protein
VKEALGYVLLAALVTLAASHVAIAVGLGKGGSWGRAAAALLIPPLAPWWAWSWGMRRRAIAWTTALVVYAIGVAIA